MVKDSCCVLILNYYTYQDTIHYVDCLQKQQYVSLSILIVDNCSPNNSFAILLEYFKSYKNVRVIQSERNGGYAYGNNYGLRYLKDISVDYILVSNNDIKIDDQMLIYKLLEKYKQLSKPAFAAPIMRVNGKQSKYAAWKIPTLRDGLIGSLGTLEKVFGDKTLYKIDGNVGAMAIDCLPGSFFVAKKEIFYDIGLMDEGTFLYMEEPILAYKVKQNKLTNYLICSMTYDHVTAKTISSQLSSIKMRQHLTNSRVYYYRKYLKTGEFGIGLLIILFQLWKIENYIYTKIKLLRGNNKLTFKSALIFFDPFFALLAVIGFSGTVSRRAMSSSSKILPLTRAVFHAMGYLPIRDHYYEPLTFNAIGSKFRDRIALLLFKNQKDFSYLRSIARPDEFMYEYAEGVIKESGFRFNNGSFGSGDAETLYYFVRGLKPKKIVEIGAGNSSLIINSALKLNAREDSNGEHIIIEPYENPWLEKLGAEMIRVRVEHVDFSIFQSLSAGDIVFIDSSHVVRAQNDCVFEYTELLPSLPSGVVVHVHDIFTPFDYPDEWLNKHFNLWSEQYMLEALLANSSNWEILAPLHWLSQDIRQFKDICPFFEEGRQPGSMWIRKR